MSFDCEQVRIRESRIEEEVVTLVESKDSPGRSKYRYTDVRTLYVRQHKSSISDRALMEVFDEVPAQFKLVGTRW